MNSEVKRLQRGIAEIMVGLASGEISGEDIVWASQIDTLWERCASLLDPDGLIEFPVEATEPGLILSKLSKLSEVQGSSPSRDLKPAVGGALDTMLQAAVRFSVWAAGEGLSPADVTVAAPEDFLFDYSRATGEEEWETLADRLPRLPSSDAPEWRLIDSAPSMQAVMLYAAGFYIGHFNTANNKWWTETDGTRSHTERALNSWNPPTHWLPLPSPPSDEARPAQTASRSPGRTENPPSNAARQAGGK